MKTPYNTLLIICAAVSFSPLMQASESYRAVKDAIVIEECGACHMTFQPEMLPQRSWNAIMIDLENHFGEDASLSTQKNQYITAYLVANAADQQWSGSKLLRGLSKSTTPLRISELPYWIKEHREEVSNREWNNPKVGSKANCLACHQQADRGYYDDD